MKKHVKERYRNFTGISSPYEAPTKAEIHVKTENLSIDESAAQIVTYLEEKGYLNVR